VNEGWDGFRLRLERYEGRTHSAISLPPTLRKSAVLGLDKVREGWGTLCVAYDSEIKSLGHPAR
jgi:hypothetical protein